MKIFDLRKRKKKFVFTMQMESSDCGPACLKMILNYHGKFFRLSYLRDICNTNRIGTSLYNILKVAEQLGLEGVSAQVKVKDLTTEFPFPAILLWNKNHFVVLVKIIYNARKGNKYLVADPAFGLVTFSEAEFKKKWDAKSEGGVIAFFELDDSIQNSSKTIETTFNNSRSYLRKLVRIIGESKTALLFIFLGMLLSSGISVTFPILTQKIVDVGIKYKNDNFLILVSGFQLILFISVLIIDFLKSWMLLHVGAKIEIRLIYDFLSKVMRLPLYFFDSRAAGDIIQRVADNNRIQNFIKSQFLDFIISIASSFALIFLILKYDSRIFIFYFVFSILSIAWSFYFIRRREILDYRRFDIQSEDTDNLIETVVGMPEIKLNNAEDQKKNNWQNIQVKLLSINTKILKLQQYQGIGSSGINQFKNIIITLIAAEQVLQGRMTLGELMSLSVIIGQLNVPLFQMVSFIQNFQDAKISFQRLADVQFKKEEDANQKSSPLNFEKCLISFPAIEIANVSFSYIDSEDDLLFKNLSLTIPKGKITALVGESGSGKTTLMKLMLRFYEPLKGSISIGNIKFDSISSVQWRSKCGVVMQDGFIFTDTVEKNIALSTESIDKEKVEHAATLACIHSFILTLPMGYETKIGSGGMGLSAGQKQRILIARAIYKNPEFIFFDEATSALDTKNEKDIHNNLNIFFKNKTVLLIAHRLSTVRNAHKIVVLEAGRIIEEGPHDRLVQNKGKYFDLVRNQLELNQ